MSYVKSENSTSVFKFYGKFDQLYKVIYGIMTCSHTSYSYTKKSLVLILVTVTQRKEIPDAYYYW